MPQKIKLPQELLKYIIVGAISTTLDAIIFKILTDRFFWDFKISLVCSYSAGVFLNFWLCYLFIFPIKINWAKAWFKHNSFSLVILAIQQLLMIIIVSFFKFNNLLLARIAVAGFTFLINYLFFKNFVFKKREY